MRRAVVITVELIDGRPNLGLTAEQRKHFTKRGDKWIGRWGGHQLAMQRIGTAQGKAVFQGIGDAKILKALDHLPSASVEILAEAFKNETKRNWLIAHGVKVTRAGRPLPMFAMAGDSPEGVGRDWEEIADDDIDNQPPEPAIEGEV